jgi:hypothetical protein
METDMPDGPIDPASLQGDALTRWYLRSPADIEQQRQAAEAQRYQDFFGGNPSGDPDPGFGGGFETPTRAVDPGSSRGLVAPTKDIDPELTWVPAGPNRWRSERAPQQDWSEGNAPGQMPVLDRGLAGPDDGGELQEIGNPHNRRLKREFKQTYGYWPKTEDGRDFDVSHKKAIADGGTNTLDNIEPMHPDDHAAKHMADGDGARWGRRASIARAFGGTVEPPRYGRTVRGFGPLGALSNLAGILSGRVRTDSFPNFTTDMLGLPSMDELGGFSGRPKWTTPGCPSGQCI